MIYLEDLQKAKEQNEQVIQGNNELIAQKQKENCELEAENRVFDKLILIEKSKSDVQDRAEMSEQPDSETPQQDVIC